MGRDGAAYSAAVSAKHLSGILAAVKLCASISMFLFSTTVQTKGFLQDVHLFTIRQTGLSLTKVKFEFEPMNATF